MRIKPINTQQQSFKSLNELKKKNDNKKQNDKQLLGSLIGLAALGTSLLLGKKSIMTYETALKKNGVQIQNGIAIITENGEKFTGSIKRNVKAFGLKKETVQFDNGIIIEKVYHNAKGKELEGEFYKNGVKRLSVSEGKDYSIIKYNSEGKLEVIGDAEDINTNKFENARNIIKNLKD